MEISEEKKQDSDIIDTSRQISRELYRIIQDLNEEGISCVYICDGDLSKPQNVDNMTAAKCKSQIHSKSTWLPQMCKFNILLLLALLSAQLHEVHSRNTRILLSMCDNYQQQFDRFSFYPYNCPTGTTWREEVGCCVGCVECNVGYMRPPECKGPCIRCPENFYNDQINSYECLPCPRCEELHRVQTDKCYSAFPTECGACIKGYFIQPGAPTTMSCIKCVPGIENPACPNITTTTTTTTMKTTSSTAQSLATSTETLNLTRVKEEQNAAASKTSNTMARQGVDASLLQTKPAAGRILDNLPHCHSI